MRTEGANFETVKIQANPHGCIFLKNSFSILSLIMFPICVPKIFLKFQNLDLDTGRSP